MTKCKLYHTVVIKAVDPDLLHWLLVLEYYPTPEPGLPLAEPSMVTLGN